MQERTQEDDEQNGDGVRVVRGFEGTVTAGSGGAVSTFTGTANVLVTAGTVDGDVRIGADGIEVGGVRIGGPADAATALQREQGLVRAALPAGPGRRAESGR